MSKDEKMSRFLPLVTMSRQQLEEEVFNTQLGSDLLADKELLWCFTALGLGGKKPDADEIVLFGNPEHGSQNFLFRGVEPDKIVDRREDSIKFLELHFNFSMDLNHNTFTCDKIFGEDSAIITDWEDRPVAAVRFIQDTRAPWVTIPGDQRPFGLTVTNRDRPDYYGCCHEFEWWHDEKNLKRLKDGRVVNRFGLKMREFGSFVDRINAEFFDVQSNFYVKPKSLNRSEKGRFVCSQTMQGGGINSCPVIEIVKSSMQTEGEIYISGILVGSVTVMNTNSMTEYPIKINADKDALTQLGFTYKQIVQSVNQTLTVEQAYKMGHRGKAQFRNTAIKDALK